MGVGAREGEDASGAARWTIVWLTIFAGVVGAFHVGKAPPAIPQIRLDLGLSFTSAGFVISVFSAAGLFIPLLAGTLTDHLGHRRMVLIGLACGAVGSFFGSFAAGTPLLLSTRALEGLGYIIIAVAAPSLISQLSKGKSRRLALGIWGAYMPAGTSLMMVLSPLLLVNFGWPALWRGMAVLSTLWLIILWWRTRGEGTMKRLEPAGSSSIWRDARRTMSTLGPWTLALSFTCYTLQYTPLISWLPTMLEGERGLTTAAAASLTALVVGVNVIGNVGAGWLLHRGVQRWVILVASGVGMGLCAQAIFSDALADGLRYGLCIVYSAFGGLLPGAVISAAPVFAPSPRQIGMLNGMIVQGANLGMFVGPPILGLFKEITGSWESASFYMLTMSAGIVLLAFAVRHKERALSTAP